MIVVAKDGSGDFTTIQAAVDSISGERRAEPARILIRGGEYRERVIVDIDNLCISGESPESTLIVRRRTFIRTERKKERFFPPR